HDGYLFEHMENPVDRLLNDSELGYSLDRPLFLGLWLTYGFAIAQLLGMLARRTIIAAILSVGLAAMVAAAWAPSLICGGLKLGQVLPIPILLLFASRLAMWPWLSRRLSAARPVVGLIAVALVAAGWQAGNLWYRVREIPDAGEPFDVQAYLANLPPPEKNE